MGVIQDNVNTMLALAAAGSRTSERYKDSEALKKSQAKQAVLEYQLHAADASLSEYKEPELYNADGETEERYRQAYEKYNSALKGLEEEALTQAELGNKYKNFQFKGVAEKADADLNYYSDLWRYSSYDSIQERYKPSQESTKSFNEITDRTEVMKDQAANVKTLKKWLEDGKQFVNSGEISKSAYSHSVRSAYKNGGNK